MKRIIIRDVRIETGFKKVAGVVSETLTDLVTIVIEDGVISQLLQADDDQLVGFRYDAKGALLLPGFTEKHCHLDKSRLGTNWQAVKRVSSIVERFEMEIGELNGLPLNVAQRAEKLIQVFQQAGVTSLRSHVDVHPRVNLDYLDQVVACLAAHSQELTAEIVAFPQHGLLRNDSRDLVRQALKQGASLVGGVDPTAVDGDMKKSLDATFGLAAEQGAGIDLHLHERNEMGLATFEYFLDLVEKYQMQNKTAVSHAFALADVTGTQQTELFSRLAEQGVSIITSVPLGNMPPVLTLQNAGVKVHVGCDNIFDNWSPYGSGDILERVGRLGEMTNQVTEYELSRTLGFITEGVTPLNDQGEQVWPKVGDTADFVFVEASCSAEAVARRSKRVATMSAGKLVAGKL
ncbi:amidohydrolase family protein [Vagococcus sp. BWB3-3]|uniref:Amidohydrolase family protein n=1 Tax=Vagococcus allomyrinae TaxID=2794353 RepID=A0A940P658_9ENTE|nr:amidohydrolase [Vagococcus allomyrinae]MBP1040471.1 amidohydrolase family protein [Vagococcus allomyrinae]